MPEHLDIPVLNRDGCEDIFRRLPIAKAACGTVVCHLVDDVVQLTCPFDRQGTVICNQRSQLAFEHRHLRKSECLYGRPADAHGRMLILPQIFMAKHAEDGSCHNKLRGRGVTYTEELNCPTASLRIASCTASLSSQMGTSPGT